MSISEVIFWGILSVLGIYIVVRLASAAYYRSKADYEKRKGN